MKPASENKMEASGRVQTYIKIMPTFQKVANRKGPEDRSYKKNSSSFQREGLKLKGLLHITSSAAHRNLGRTYSYFLLSERNSCTSGIRLP